MKGLNVLGLLLGAAAIGVGAAMAATNPSQSAYEEYATQQLTLYLSDNVCSKAPSFLGNSLQEQCVALVNDNQAQLKTIISSNTERQNYFLFSVYKTDLSASEFLPPFLSPSVPSYHVETVGAFQQFRIYKAEQIRQP